MSNNVVSSSKVYTSRFGTEDGAKHWISLDICGWICVIITYFLIFYGSYACTTVVILPYFGWTLVGLVHISIFNTILFLAAICQIKAMTTNPGAVPKDAIPLDMCQYENDEDNDGKIENQTFRKCRRCESFKPVRAHHCSICKRCVVKMDHQYVYLYC